MAAESDARGPVETHTWRVPRGGEFFLTLPDGTRVWLNSESTIVYPNRFDAGERRIRMEGEAYFDVVKNGEQPFVVEAGGARIDVTGTRFNVAAYGDMVETTLAEGGVRMTAGGSVVELRPDMQAVYVAGGDAIAVRSVDAAAYGAWKEGLLEFRDLPLSEITARLGRWYDVDFSFERSEVADMRFTGAFKREDSIVSILDVIKNTKSVGYSIDGNTITLK
jgi:ferric-dicitrate binding protein FerR (iron transport regulator)